MIDQKKMKQLNEVFEMSPLRHNYSYYGNEEIKEELLYRVVSKSITLIIGGRGFGKTALLKHIINNFGGKNRILYLNSNRPYDLEKMLKNKKNMILLFDNVSFLKKSEIERIKYYYDEDILDSIVFTTESKDILSFSDSMWSRIGKNIIELKETSFLEFKEMMIERLGEDNVFNDESLSIVYNISKDNKFRLLTCKRVYEYLLNSNHEEFDENLVLEMLKKYKKSLEEQ
ncbi:MAG: AAA family ATPase [Candidatus Nanoarchaeia archaeon]|nr:AAA family ATPase [Candidatus Nanoarchaeia archaeon]